MATAGFDTHKAVKALTDAGFSESQAETVVSTVSDAIGSDLATKSELKAELKELELRLTIRIGGAAIATIGVIVVAMAFFEYLS